MSEYLSAAAAALGLPEPLVQRSAAARAAETGVSVDEVLQAWAGGGEVTPAAAAESPPEAEEAPEAKEAPAAPAQPPPEAEPTPTPSGVGVAAARPAAGPAPTRAPVPEVVTPGEASRLPEVVTVPTAGIREKTSFAIPRWLTAVLLVAPIFALFALGGSATGQCGEATELRVDVVTGEIVNCDGSEFTGQAAGGGGTDFIALGERIYQGGEVSGVNCAACHGAGGEGSGAFPALTGVMTTFGSCQDHIEWVSLGTGGFQAAGRDTYGDTAKQVGGAGNMPSFSSSLSTEQIAAVAAFERARFGGGDRDTVLADCGLVEEPAGEGGQGEGGTGEESGEGGPGGEQGSGGAEASAASSG